MDLFTVLLIAGIALCFCVCFFLWTAAVYFVAKKVRLADSHKLHEIQIRNKK